MSDTTRPSGTAPSWPPQWVRRIFVLRLGWALCDQCGRLRPNWWATRRWAVLGGQAGYFDFCSSRCEEAHRGA